MARFAVAAVQDGVAGAQGCSLAGLRSRLGSEWRKKVLKDSLSARGGKAENAAAAGFEPGTDGT